MATMASTVAAIRRIVNDEPDETTATAAITTTAATTVTVADIAKFAAGQTWEFDDGSGEQILITNITETTDTITMKRAHRGSTAATHLDDCVMLKSPRFAYDTVTQAVNTVLDADLYQEGLFDLAEHQITSSGVTDHYNAPTTGCMEFLDVYQKTSVMLEPARERLQWSKYPRNVDTSLYANGKYFIIQGNYGDPGVDLYYISCAEKLQVGTLDASEERIVQFLSCAYLMEWGEPRRIAGPTNQGDTTVKVGSGIAVAQAYRALAEELMTKKRRELAQLYPPVRRFVRT